MLRVLTIKNFKSIGFAVLRFSKGLNLIIGSSQTGKSAVLEAFELLKDNRPLGGRYMKGRVPGEVFVGAAFDDCEMSITKQVGKEDKVKKASYHLSGMKKPFSAIGNKVPDVVIKALNMSDINIQEQSDDSYLVTSKGGEFARTISRFIRMDVVEMGLASLKSSISDSNSRISYVESSINKDEAKLRRYRVVFPIEISYKKLKGIRKEIIEIDDSIREIERFIRTCDKAERDIEFVDSSKKRFEDYFDIVSRIRELEDEIVDLDVFVRASTDLDDAKDRLEASRSSIDKAIKDGKVCSKCLSPEVCPHCFRRIRE